VIFQLVSVNMVKENIVGAKYLGKKLKVPFWDKEIVNKIVEIY